MELRLRIAYGTVQELGNFVVLVPLEFVQRVDPSATFGKGLHCAKKGDPVESSGKARVPRSNIMG